MILPQLSFRIPGGQAVRPLLDVQVARDGPLGVFVPQGPADFAALGLPVPDFLWLCQEATGNLTPAIGNTAVQLAPNASPLYQQSVTGWSRKFVGTTDGTAGHRFSTTHASLDLAVGESYAVVALMSMASSASNSVLLAQSGTDKIRFLAGGGDGRLNGNFAGVSTTMPGSYNDASVVGPLVWYRECAANVSGCYTAQTSIIGTHDEAAKVGLDRGIGNTGSSAAALTRCGWYAVYKGVNAEGRDWKSYLQKLGCSLSY
jgi:hypothetical protein